MSQEGGRAPPRRGVVSPQEGGSVLLGKGVVSHRTFNILIETNANTFNISFFWKTSFFTLMFMRRIATRRKTL